MSEHHIRIGMVGGGPGAGIARAHRMGMRLDDRYALVAGAFSRSAHGLHEMGEALGIAADRRYQDYREMAKAEAARPDGIEAVSIVTPNDSHYPVAQAFLEAGIHVICDKPMTSRLDDARALHELARSSGRLFVLTHNYSAYAMVRQAAQLIRDGALGDIRIVMVEHASGWAAEAVENNADNKQAAWRLDPDQAGRASLIFDLGTHAHQLLRFVSGLEVTEVSAGMQTCVPGRRVFDDAQIQVRLSNGARGTLWASMAATGHEHGLRLRIFGEKASLEWRQMDPHYLTLHHPGGRHEVFSQGHVGQGEVQARITRVGSGHPEGFIESFANLYSDVAEAIHRHRSSGQVRFDDLPLPGSEDGLMGLRFVQAVETSHDQKGLWTAL